LPLRLGVELPVGGSLLDLFLLVALIALLVALPSRIPCGTPALLYISQGAGFLVGLGVLIGLQHMSPNRITAES
jgi:hypothetical protein